MSGPDGTNPALGHEHSAARRPGFAIFALTIAGAAQSADVTLHNTAVATAAIDLGMSSTERAFGASVGTLALAASILTVGTLGDRFGRRLVLLWCCGFLVLGGLLTAAAPAVPVYMMGRVLTGIGLAGTLALSMALIRTVAPDRVPRAMSLYFAGQVGFALPLGVVGGALIGVSWRLGYLVVPLVGVAAFLLNAAFVPRAKAVQQRKPDPVGLVLVAVALVAVIWGVSDASAGWLTARVAVPVLIGVAAFVAFLFWETRIDEPALPVGLFRNPDLTGALSADVSFNMFQAVITLQLSLLWQYVYLYEPLDVSLAQLPNAIAMVCGAIAAGRLATRGRSPESIVLFGLSGVVVATLLLALVGTSSPYWVFAIGLVVGGLSRMLTETAAGEFFVGIPPADLVGATVASKPAIGQASFALALALSSTFLYGHFGRGLQATMDDQGLTPAQQAQSLGWFNGDEVPAWIKGTPQFRDLVAGAQDAYVDAYRFTMLIFAGMFTVVLAITAYFLWWKQRDATHAGS